MTCANCEYSLRGVELCGFQEKKYIFIFDKIMSINVIVKDERREFIFLEKKEFYFLRKKRELFFFFGNNFEGKVITRIL